MKIHLLALVMFMVSGCTIIHPPMSNNVTLDPTTFNDETVRKGEGCAWYFLGFLGPFGSSSILSALEDQPMKKISFVEYRASNYFVVAGLCTVVHGIPDEEATKRERDKDAREEEEMFGDRGRQ